MATLKESWFIPETQLDQEQKAILKFSLNQSYVVKGCAGSGKTVLALWRAIQVINKGKGDTCIIIVYQRTLKRFMRMAERINPLLAIGNIKIYTDFQWRHYEGKPGADHFIVDEAQDFSKEEILEFAASAKKSIAFFGDSAQQLFPDRATFGSDHKISGKTTTVTVEAISTLLDLPLRALQRNYRLPKRIARFAQPLNPANDDIVALCKNEGERKPSVICCNSLEEELEAIASLVKSRGYTDVGIFLPHNGQVKFAFDYLVGLDLPCEVRWKLVDEDQPFDTLKFDTDNPKIMTYHNAKGLQFQQVFMPSVNQQTWIDQAPMYVAATRASRELYVSYSGKSHPLLQNISKAVYDFTDYTVKSPLPL